MSLLNIHQVARHYGKTVSQVKYAISKGLIIPQHEGKNLVFDKNTLPAWAINNHKKISINRIRQENALRNIGRGYAFND